MKHNLDFPETRPSRVKMIIIIVAAILLYGLFAGIRANTSILSLEISEFTGIPYGEISLAFSILNLVLAVSMPIIGILTLKVQKFYILLAGAILCAIGFIGTAFSMSTPLLILFIGIFFGFGAAALSFTIVYSAAKPFVGEKASSIFAGVLLASQGILGMVAAHAIDGFIEGFGLTLCLVIISVSAMCLVPLTFLFQQKNKKNQINEVEESEKSHSVGHVLKKIFSNPLIYILALGAFAFGMGDGGMINHASEYFTELFQTGEYSPYIVSTYSISIMAGALFGGFLGGKVKHKMLACGIIFLLWALTNFLIQSLIANNCFGFNVPITTICITFITGFFINSTYPLIIAALGERVSLVASAVTLSVLDCAGFIAYSLDSFFGGILHDIFGNFHLIDTIVTYLAILTGIIFIAYTVKRRNKKPDIIV